MLQWCLVDQKKMSKTNEMQWSETNLSRWPSFSLECYRLYRAVQWWRMQCSQVRSQNWISTKWQPQSSLLTWPHPHRSLVHWTCTVRSWWSCWESRLDLIWFVPSAWHLPHSGHRGHISVQQMTRWSIQIKRNDIHNGGKSDHKFAQRNHDRSVIFGANIANDWTCKHTA